MATKDKLVNLEDLKSVYDHGMDLLDEKANQVGEYVDLTAGYADNLVSSSYTEDSTPYLFRKTFAGVREDTEIVGGSIVWNQLSQTTRASFTAHGLTYVGEDGKTTVTGTFTGGTGSAARYGDSNKAIPAGHKVALLGGKSDTWFLRLQGMTYTPTKGNDIIKATDGALADIVVRPNLATNTEVNEEFYFQIIDLTLMFGPTVADYIYSLEQATAGAGVAFFRSLFSKPYYPYNAGEIISVNTSAHKMVGFNQFAESNLNSLSGITQTGDGWDGTGVNWNRSTNVEGWENVTYFPNTAYCATVELTTRESGGVRVRWEYTDGTATDGTLITANTQGRTTVVSNPAKTIKNCHLTFGSAGSGVITVHNFCINISSSRNGQYEPYTAHTYPLDSTLTLRGIPTIVDGKLVYDGDIYPPSGEGVQNYTDEKSASALTWHKNGNYSQFYAQRAGLVTDTSGGTIRCNRYASGDAYAREDKTICCNANYIWIADSSYSTLDDFVASLTGVKYVAKVVAPTAFTADPYTNPQVCYPNGTEEYIDTRDVPIPVGHNTKYMRDLKKLLEGIPDAPTANGTYVLKATVSSSGVTYSWVEG